MTDLKEILAIPGKPGLFKIIARSNSGFIVESMDAEKKRFPINANSQVSMLGDITIYNHTAEDLMLTTILENIEKKDGATLSVSPNDSPTVLRDYFKEVAPEHDEERVYMSDIKKILKWYAALAQANN
ncbi:MAG: DUF5606 domain-containing protein [Bacteroidetes bacterium]|nr:DUF5606 domain-containing protein [Bacteroidota bacterium]